MSMAHRACWHSWVYSVGALAESTAAMWQGQGFRSLRSEVYRASGLGLRVWDLGLRVWDLGFRVWDLGFGI